MVCSIWYSINSSLQGVVNDSELTLAWSVYNGLPSKNTMHGERYCSNELFVRAIWIHVLTRFRHCEWRTSYSSVVKTRQHNCGHKRQHNNEQMALFFGTKLFDPCCCQHKYYRYLMKHIPLGRPRGLCLTSSAQGSTVCRATFSSQEFIVGSTHGIMMVLLVAIVGFRAMWE